jgi:hypothetical protein
MTPQDFSGTPPQNCHHIRLLVESGLIDSAGPPTMQAEYSIRGLTFPGHDFLDAIRDKSVWERTKEKMAHAGGWTFDLVLAVAKEELKRRLLGGLSE